MAGPEKKKIQDWWADNPMTYGKRHGETTYQVDDERRSTQIGTRDFFAESDRVFLSWNSALHDESGQFGKIFDYERYVSKPVLEIGCGLGLMAMNWAKHGARIVATDLNPVAVHQTRNRFALFGLAGEVLENDAEHLPFAQKSFDYIYSWGVLHHTPGIQKAIDGIYNLLKPAGGIGLMLYNRNSLKSKYLVEYVQGYLHLENEFLKPLELQSRYADGGFKEGNPHTWPVTVAEVKNDLLKDFKNVQVKLLGSEIKPLLDLVAPGLGSYLLPAALKNALARHLGWSLWITGEKPR